MFSIFASGQICNPCFEADFCAKHDKFAKYSWILARRRTNWIIDIFYKSFNETSLITNLVTLSLFRFRFFIMDRIVKSQLCAATAYPLSFDLKRTAIEYQMTASWRKPKHDRGSKGKQGKEAKHGHSTNGGVGSRKMKNINRSPRQVRRNERERGRKARLNAAFKVLRNVIPFYSEGLNKEKLTQVQVLRLAAKYIMTLSDILGSDTSESEEEEFYARQFSDCQYNYDMLQYVNQQ